MVDDVLAARRPEDLFGALGDEAELRRAVRGFASVHPDVCDDPRAEDAFKRLNILADQARARFERGVYGSALADVCISTKRWTYGVEREIARGDSCNVYSATYRNPAAAVDLRRDAVLKIARSPRDNDLMGNEARAIRQILSDADTYDHSQPYMPRYIESFTIGSGERRRGNAFQFVEGLVTLDRVREVYQRGVHPKDMAWMFRRILFVLGFAHANGVIHGAVLPQHVLLMPEHHGVVLVDWRAAAISGGKIKALSSVDRSWYPAQVLDGKEATRDVDLHMATLCMEYVVGGRECLPKPLRAFLKGCRVGAVPEAWEIRDEFDDLIERMWGPRKFRPFSMPATGRIG